MRNAGLAQILTIFDLRQRNTSMLRTKALALVAIVAILVTGCASDPRTSTSGIFGPEVIQLVVTGVGPDFESARSDGFKKAIQGAYGALVLSERRVTNDDLFEDMVSYSKGLVSDYDIQGSYISPDDKLMRLHMRVDVSTSEMGKAIIYSSDADSVDGGALGLAIDKAHARPELENEQYEDM